MPDTWITDLRHGIELLDPNTDAPASARRFWQYLARITLAGSAWYVDTELKTIIRCRRRPQRRACPGTLRLARTTDGEIHWECMACQDRGVIRGWEGTDYDLSEPEEIADFVTVITPELYDDLSKMSDPPRLARRVVVRGALEEGGVLLMGSPAELNAIKSVVTEARDKARGQHRAQLEQLLDKLFMADAEPDDLPESGDAISETLLTFAKPLLDAVGDEPAPVVKNLLTVAVMIWNSLTLEAWGRGDNYLDQARAQLAKELPQFMSMFELLVVRKKRHYATDLRAIGDFDVTRKDDGELEVTADAWLPNSLQTVN